MDVPLDDDAVGPDDQQPSQGALAHLRRGPAALLAPGGMLSWRQAKPRRKVPRLPERVIPMAVSVDSLMGIPKGSEL
jgi:hypothetical protein